MWIKNIYWKLEKMSCVLVLRNQKWFQDNVQQMGNVWNIIEKERIDGCEHRAPNKRNKTVKPETTFNKNGFPQGHGNGCLLNLQVKKLPPGTQVQHQHTITVNTEVLKMNL
jgi:hypothetical protein